MTFGGVAWRILFSIPYIFYIYDNIGKALIHDRKCKEQCKALGTAHTI